VGLGTKNENSEGFKTRVNITASQYKLTGQSQNKADNLEQKT